MPKRNVVAGVDVGSTKVTVVIGELIADGRVRIIGLGRCQASGLRKGVIVDIESTAKAIQSALEQAQRMSGTEVSKVHVGVTGTHIASFSNRGVVAVASPEREINVLDVERVLDAARVVAMPHDRRIIHVLPREFIVDGYDGVVDPVGMSGSRLEVQTQIVTAAANAVQNLLKCINKAGLESVDLVLNSLAAAEAVLYPAEQELGAAVVDIGGGTTDIAIFDRGGLWFTSTLPVGGDHVTNDLAVGLRTPLVEAERVKQEHGCVLAALMSEATDIEVETIGGRNKYRVSRRMLADIIEPRMQEIFRMVKNEIDRSGHKGLLPGGVVVTGGGALLDGIMPMAAEELGFPVRLGIPAQVDGLVDIVAAPQYSAGVGIILYASRAHSLQSSGSEPLGGLWTRVKSWFRDFMDLG